MSKQPDKQELQAAAKRAIDRQPDTIRLVADAQHQWANSAAIQEHAEALQMLGFADAGTYGIDPLSVALRIFLKASDRMYATVYEHAKAGVWLNFVVLDEDGSSITFTTTQDRGLEQRPGHPIVHVHGASADRLYPVAISRAPEKGRKPLTPESIATEFERAWAEGIRWKKSRGVSINEVASVLLSKGGRDARMLRADRIQYVAEQDGEPERELKARFVKVFEKYPVLEKAYLVLVRYDEVPEVSVAVCLVSKSKDPALFNAVRTAFASVFASHVHLDILFVAESEITRIERVCRPFYTKRLPS